MSVWFCLSNMAVFFCLSTGHVNMSRGHVQHLSVALAAEVVTFQQLSMCQNIQSMPTDLAYAPLLRNKKISIGIDCYCSWFCEACRSTISVEVTVDVGACHTTNNPVRRPSSNAVILCIRDEDIAKRVSCVVFGIVEQCTRTVAITEIMNTCLADDWPPLIALEPFVHR